ncbi:helix-turn-helix domain-containing protein [Mucilaginibacter flavus]|uniref:helix-turn-helix domain-containing protein n=1 Tax=Mucilaginibacter flavus TaxID=931504 RepID=UPI0025B28491|nr:helix-turn-helix transcriptional regulator [Mucilaginibacter flavus]MDN3583634.1 helix-turn-helix transcriptional regulator [Mucilaginibacter flavus]
MECQLLFTLPGCNNAIKIVYYTIQHVVIKPTALNLKFNLLIFNGAKIQNTYLFVSIDKRSGIGIQVSTFWGGAFLNTNMSNVVKSRIKAIVGRIRVLRRSKNYSQDYMAAKLNMSQNAYSKIELGYTNITLEDFINIADLLNTSEHELLDSI